jgi:hypothetical protein
MKIFRDLHHDAKLLMASRGIRAFAFSFFVYYGNGAIE